MIFDKKLYKSWKKKEIYEAFCNKYNEAELLREQYKQLQKHNALLRFNLKNYQNK